ncbi:MFS transporter [Streptosporangium sp. NPDC020145]|uniref:MFS transporter n=1 Tax=Streptosporangium sp. NPDC020145 TaxID=3154694 RepID=UPI003418D5EC
MNRTSIVMCAASVLVVSLVAAVNLALPALTGALHPTESQLVWIVDAYVLVFACLLIPMGAAGDRLGGKGVLLTGLAVFAAGSLAAALAPHTGALIAARALSGAGAAMIMPASLSITVAAHPPQRRAHAVGLWSAASGAAGVVGNVGGGLIIQYLPWQALFAVPALLALLLAGVTGLLVPRQPRRATAVDPVGTGLLVLGCLALVFAIIEGPEAGWTSAVVLGAFATAAVVLTGFVLHQLRIPRPLLDPRLFARRELRAGALGVSVLFFGLFALFFVNARFLQEERGLSPMVTGLAILPLVIPMVALSGRRAPTLPAVAGGLASVVAGLGWLAWATTLPYPLYAAGLVLVGAGMGLALPALSTQIMAGLPAGRAGLGSGLNSAARELGSAVGVAVMGTALATSGLRAGLVIVALCVAVGAAPVVGWLRTGTRALSAPAGGPLRP